MKATWCLGAAGALALWSSTSGCAFFNKSDPVLLRYFTPEAVGSRPVSSADTPRAAPTLELRLGRVDEASYLKDRIAFRDDGFEVGYYERLRWTEKPEAYLRRALGRALFQDGRVGEIVSGPGPTLDVDVDAFEELRSPRHAARIQLTLVLHDDRHVQFQETLTIERPIASTENGSAEIARAMAGALDEAVRRVLAQVMVALPATTAVAVVAP
jgi:ABC-type uncharacterized transport system auxiliary subunit